MRNLKPYDNDSFEFHEDIIFSKNQTKVDPDYKKRVQSLNNKVKVQHHIYLEHFKLNSLEEVKSIDFNDDEADDLLKLYSFKNKKIQELKIKITTTENNRIINTCQNCTINSINSFDHYLPKTDFVEFVVNPLNLFPSCSECNSYKKDNCITDDGNRAFLNLYSDLLPAIQYLFVQTDIDEKGIINASFFLQNTNNVDENVFNLINNHYTKLKLCKRFSENIDNVVTSLINIITPHKGSMAEEEIKRNVIETSNLNKLAFGHNYWKSILEEDLVKNQKFILKYLK